MKSRRTEKGETQKNSIQKIEARRKGTMFLSKNQCLNNPAAYTDALEMAVTLLFELSLSAAKIELMVSICVTVYVMCVCDYVCVTVCVFVGLCM